MADPSSNQETETADEMEIGIPTWMLFAVILGLIVCFFYKPIFQDQNFVYRDAGHFYYPYFKLQVEEWSAGRVPLWNPYENGGEPLAGNPTASVFYPGKAIFALPYGFAYKWYLLGHLLLAIGTSYLAGRRLGVVPVAAVLAAVAYGMSGFILFQLYNIVFLVGAAWLPLGLISVHEIVQRPSVRSLFLLAGVLALQTLGGDPQVAQMTGLIAIVYSLFFHLALIRAMTLTLCGLAMGAAIVHIGPVVRAGMQVLLKKGTISEVIVGISDDWSERGAILSAIALSLCISVAMIIWMRKSWMNGALGQTLGSLVLAGILSAGLAALQILPTLEFASLSGRASPDAIEETVAFSLHPLRLLEFVSPSLFGHFFPENSRWFPFAEEERSVWIPTLYFGFIPFAIAVASMRFWKGPSTQQWLTWMTLITLWLALGRFGGMTWLIDPSQNGLINPIHAERGTRLYGNSDGLYWLAENTIPGFKQFRYPSKLLVFVSLGLALLSGLGLDQLLRRTNELRTHRTALFIASIGISLPIVALVCWFALATFVQSTSVRATSYGPFNAGLATYYFFAAISTSFVMGIALLVSLWLLKRDTIDSSKVAMLLLIITLFDVRLSNQWLVLTDKQSIIDEKPAALAVIEEHREKSGETDLYRIHRTRTYEPIRFRGTENIERIQEQTRWERMTAQPKYALPFRIAYSKTEGTMNQYDIDFFFAPWVVPTPAPLQTINPHRPKQMVYYARNGFNLWNTRYFILPKLLVLDDVDRGSFTLFVDRQGKPLPIIKDWSAKEEDCIIFENTEAFPRTWLVRETEVLPEIHHLRRRDRSERMEKLLYRSQDGGLPLWVGEPYGDYPLRQRAMVETEHTASIELLAKIGSTPEGSQSSRITHYEPDEVIIETEGSGGLLVLADAYYPGWSATIDGISTDILRTNRAMRGVIVPEGNHRIEFRYRSRPFEVGSVISALTVLGMTLCWFWNHRRKPV
ncbi:YfhO family protein [bacterium]|nr:YfhO family protein [bacterium]